MRILGIETSCDETSVAIVRDGKIIEDQIIYSQIQEHEKFFGVVPELASRIHFEKLFPLLEEILERNQISWEQIDAIAVTQKPGLLGSLLLGFTVAKTLAFFLNKPLIPVNHLWGHLYAPFLGKETPPFPYGGLIVSGGHTLLARIHSYDHVEILGSSLDDAIGECYDKVAKMLGLGYPGGPLIDAQASIFEGQPTYRLPIANIEGENPYTFSYSGLKTAARNLIEQSGEKLHIQEFCAVFQKAAIEQLMKASKIFVSQFQLKDFVISGGVAANSFLRSRAREELDCTVHFPPKSLCTDNAAMIAGLAEFLPLYYAKDFLSLDVQDKILSFLDKKELRGKVV